MSPTSPASEAAQHQDVAAERMLVASQMAVQAAQAGAEEPPPTLAPAIEAAVFTALVALVAMNSRRTPATPRPPMDVLHQRAAQLEPQVEAPLWQAAKERVASTAAERTDVPTIARELARSAGTQVASMTTDSVADLMGWTYKVWLTRGDEKVRPSHRALHGKVVEVDKPFKRWPDGQVLDFPGDRRAPIGEWAGPCRCFMFASPTKSMVSEALSPANLDKAFALAASLEARWRTDP